MKSGYRTPSPQTMQLTIPRHEPRPQDRLETFASGLFSYCLLARDELKIFCHNFSLEKRKAGMEKLIEMRKKR